jgi:4-aminobutyrate aminotransferase-like enzyme
MTHRAPGAAASGQYLFDVDGRRYLDGMAQNVCISVGYRQPGVDAAVRAQHDEIQHVTTVYDHAQPGHFARSWSRACRRATTGWCTSSTAAPRRSTSPVMVARLATGHFEVLTLRDAITACSSRPWRQRASGTPGQPMPLAPGLRPRHGAASIPGARSGGR